MRRIPTMLVAACGIGILLGSGCTGDVLSPGSRNVPPAPAVASVQVSPGDVTLPVGQVVRLSARALDSTGSAISAAPITWSTSSPAVATIDGDGTVHGVAAGSATVTAAAGGKSSSVSVTVTTPSISTAIPVYPGDSIQLKVKAAAPGSQFLIKAGVHRRQTITPKDGMTFVGEPGAVLDGENVSAYAFETLTSNPVNVTIKGLVITRYVPPAQRAAIQGDNGTGWVIADNEVSYSAYEAIHPGRKAQVLRNHAHHNTVGGIAGYKADSTVVEGNEVAFNGNGLVEDPATAEAAGMKFMKQHGLVIRNNNVHDNIRGLWMDTGYMGTIIEGNTVTGSEKSGIWIEATYGAIVRNNRAENNGGTTTGGWLGHAGIQVTNSPNVEIYGNIVSNNMNGIGVMETSGYPDGPYGPLHVTDLYVHDNTITMATGSTGLGQNVGDTSVYTSRNNRFVHNSYTLGTSTGYFAWNDRVDLTPAEWQSAGQDLTGTFAR